MHDCQTIQSSSPFLCMPESKPVWRSETAQNRQQIATTAANLVCHRSLFCLAIPSMFWCHTVKLPSSIGSGEAKISSSHLHRNQHNHRPTATNPDPHVRLMALARSMCPLLPRRTKQQIFTCDLRRLTQNHSTNHICSRGSNHRSK